MSIPSHLSSFGAIFRKPRDLQRRPLNHSWAEAAYRDFFNFDTTMLPFLTGAMILLLGKIIGANVSDPQAVHNAAAIGLMLNWPVCWLVITYLRVRTADTNHPRFEMAPAPEPGRVRGGQERARKIDNALSMFASLGRRLDGIGKGDSDLRQALRGIGLTGMQWRDESYVLAASQEQRGHHALVTLASYCESMRDSEKLKTSDQAHADLCKAIGETRELIDRALAGQTSAEIEDFSGGVRALSRQIGSGPILDVVHSESSHAG